MNTKKVGIKKTLNKKEVRHAIPNWIPKQQITEKDLCPECFKAVGEESRYNLVCMLGSTSSGMSVGELTRNMGLKQPTVSHHLQVLQSINAVQSKTVGRTKIYKLNRNAHCFETCKIPY